MKTGSKIVLMRDKRYGICRAGRYSQAKIATLVSDHYEDNLQHLIFTSDDEQVTATKKQYGSLIFEHGWYPAYIDIQLPYQDEALAANLARYIESTREASIIHIGAQADKYTLGTAIVRDHSGPYRFGSNDITVDMPIILDSIKATPGSLIACDLAAISENEHGLISYQARDIEVLSEKISHEAIEEYSWPGVYLMCPSKMSEMIDCHRLAKIEDIVLFYVSNDDVTVITHQGLRSHQSSDIQADAWHWGNGEPDGFYIARNLAWAGSGEDVELEAECKPADDQEVAKIMLDHGFGSTELADHDIAENDVMRIAAIIGDIDQVLTHIAELTAKNAEAKTKAA